jgi:hypothetical protein
MALPRRFGKPDLFITMTCNPTWPEIEAEIPHGSHWVHHPDIVARVFLLKLDELMDEICEKKLFGKVLGHVHRIEWQVRIIACVCSHLICDLQARGLPHAHILIILEIKILCSRQVDAIISAEVPNPVTNPKLYGIVSKNMIHKPCDNNPSSGCRVKGKNGQCFRHYPKTLLTATSTSGEGYPMYRRRGLFTTRVGDRLVTDDWVVPHNPYLLVRFNCHINVEVSSHRRCFKYVYKYVFKVN